MKLNKGDFRDLNGTEFEIIVSAKERDEILKNQEDAKQWKIYLDGGINNLFEMVVSDFVHVY